MDNLVDTDDEEGGEKVRDDLVDTGEDTSDAGGDENEDDLVDTDEGEDEDESEDDLVDSDEDESECEPPPRSGRFRLNQAIDEIIAREASRARESATRETKRARL